MNTNYSLCFASNMSGHGAIAGWIGILVAAFGFGSNFLIIKKVRLQCARANKYTRKCCLCLFIKHFLQIKILPYLLTLCTPLPAYLCPCAVCSGVLAMGTFVSCNSMVFFSFFLWGLGFSLTPKCFHAFTVAPALVSFKAPPIIIPCVHQLLEENNAAFFSCSSSPSLSNTW